jgi:hypothetical protein
MKWLESRILWGSLLIIGGVLFLLQNLRIFEFGDLFWAALFFLAGLFFFSLYRQERANWWSLIPGFTLLGIGAQIAVDRLFPGASNILGGLLVLGSIGLSFLVIYLLNRANWWAIIPGGVMVTLAVVSAVSEALPGVETGGVFFLGLGLTFALVALLPSPDGQMKWAWIPAAIMLVMGTLLLATAEKLIAYIGPAALILIGGYLILRTFMLPNRGSVRGRNR